MATRKPTTTTGTKVRAKKPTRTPSTRRLGDLPEPARLRRLTQSIALLDEILCDDWEGRYYSYDPAWGAGEELAQMRNGSGDTWFLLFKPAGLVLLGFDHEASPMTPYARPDTSLWPGLTEGIAESLAGALVEPAFSPPDFTFCIWRAAGDDGYRIGPIAFPQREGVEPYRSDPDGSQWLLSILDDEPRTYAKAAAELFEREVDAKAVAKIYAGEPLRAATVHTLAEEADVEAIFESARAMGYPIAEE